MGLGEDTKKGLRPARDLLGAKRGSSATVRALDALFSAQQPNEVVYCRLIKRASCP